MAKESKTAGNQAERFRGDLLIRVYCSTLWPRRLETSSNPHPHTPFLIDSAASDAPNWLVAARAAESKKAKNLTVLDFRGVTSFTDFFIICTSTSQRQGQTTVDEIGRLLKEMGELPVSVEGYETGEWILVDYGDFVVHVFSETARAYYQLERLWQQAKTIKLTDFK